MLETTEGSAKSTESNLNLGSSEEDANVSSDEYVQLQRRIFRAHFAISLFAVAITALIIDLHTSLSLFIGAISGVLYLRLLARSIGQLGRSSKSVSKVQLVVPVLLVLAVSRLPALELIPALLGFLLFKPAVIFQFLLESRSTA